MPLRRSSRKQRTSEHVAARLGCPEAPLSRSAKALRLVYRIFGCMGVVVFQVRFDVVRIVTIGDDFEEPQ
jgi:hypothetical protein